MAVPSTSSLDPGTSSSAVDQSSSAAPSLQVSRQKGVVVCRPIIYGSIAYYLGRKAEETKTHRWHIYVRGVECEDLSYMISKVVISLHASFPNPIRVITEPPFEVSECGWGEFEVNIQIHFQDAAESPVDIRHMLKLYPPGNQPANTKKPVLHEYYDELVFNEPTEFFYKKLMAGPERTLREHPFKEHFPVYAETADVQKLYAAQEWVNDELARLTDRLLTAEVEAKQLKSTIAETEKKKKSAASSASK